ncbi:MAG: hypothetical protein WA091_00275 [Minisyncoccales bacterium]
MINVFHGLIGLILLIAGAFLSVWFWLKEKSFVSFGLAVSIFFIGFCVVFSTIVLIAGTGAPMTELSSGKEYVVLNVYTSNNDAYLTLQDVKGGNPFWYKTETKNTFGQGIQAGKKVFMIETETGLQLRTYT